MKSLILYRKHFYHISQLRIRVSHKYFKICMRLKFCFWLNWSVIIKGKNILGQIVKGQNDSRSNWHKGLKHLVITGNLWQERVSYPDSSVGKRVCPDSRRSRVRFTVRSHLFPSCYRIGAKLNDSRWCGVLCEVSSAWKPEKLVERSVAGTGIVPW